MHMIYLGILEANDWHLYRFRCNDYIHLYVRWLLIIRKASNYNNLNIPSSWLFIVLSKEHSILSYTNWRSSRSDRRFSEFWGRKSLRSYSFGRWSKNDVTSLKRLFTVSTRTMHFAFSLCGWKLDVFSICW
jgi:hypothetical protein